MLDSDKRTIGEIPYIVSEAVPADALYMLPPDVLRAIQNSERAAHDACVWFALYLFAPILYPIHWWVIAPALATATRRAINDLENHILSAEGIIAQAAKERRIGCITNIGGV